jgi:hypothetical protein
MTHPRSYSGCSIFDVTFSLCNVVSLQNMRRTRHRLRRERWQVTCGLVLIYTLVHHVASNGGTDHFPATSSAAPTDEMVNHFYQFKYEIRTDIINLLFSTHKPCYIAIFVTP